MLTEIRSLFEEILNSLRETSYAHSEERREFAITRLKGHRDHMAGLARYSPYTNFDEWEEYN